MAKSKVQQIKDDQGYTKNAPKCSNCKYYSSETVTQKSAYSSMTWSHEAKSRCNLGGFACGKVSWCKAHAFGFTR